MITPNWQWEENPQWDSTGTVAKSWYAEHSGYSCRIDRFTEAEGGGYAYTVSKDGSPVREGENEPAESFEAAEEAVLHIIAR